MKAVYFHTIGAIALTFTLAACVPSVEPPAPAPAPVQRPAPTPTPSPVVQEPRYDNFLDAPQTPGTWSYRDEGSETLAYFGSASAPQTALAFSCDRAARTIRIGRPGYTADRMTIRTETVSRALPAGSGRIAIPPSTVAELSANDPFLDAMAITKGRFAVETPGFPTLYVPAWVEVSRVIEDCR